MDRNLTDRVQQSDQPGDRAVPLPNGAAGTALGENRGDAASLWYDRQAHINGPRLVPCGGV